MAQAAFNMPPIHYAMYAQNRFDYDAISCNWQILRDQLLAQWRKISARELDTAGPDRYRIAHLIERKYGISACLVENYLRNFERTMPLNMNA